MNNPVAALYTVSNAAEPNVRALWG